MVNSFWIRREEPEVQDIRNRAEVQALISMAQNLGPFLLLTPTAGWRVLCPTVLWAPTLLGLCLSTQAPLLFLLPQSLSTKASLS